MDAVEVLERAADIVAERGWYQGGFVDPETGAVCAGMAMLMAAGAAEVRQMPSGRYRSTAHSIDPAASYAHSKAINRFYETIGRVSVSRWNDDVCESVEDLNLAFKRAVRAAVEQQ